MTHRYPLEPSSSSLASGVLVSLACGLSFPRAFRCTSEIRAFQGLADLTRYASSSPCTRARFLHILGSFFLLVLVSIWSLLVVFLPLLVLSLSDTCCLPPFFSLFIFFPLFVFPCILALMHLESFFHFFFSLVAFSHFLL